MIDNLAKLDSYTKDWDAMALEEFTMSLKIVDLITILDKKIVWK